MRPTIASFLMIGALAYPLSSQTASIAAITPLGPVGRLNGLNKGNQIVGHTLGGEGTGAFIYENDGSITPINIPGSEHTLALGIENNGRVVGQYRDKNGSHGFIYFHGSLTATIDWPDPAIHYTVAAGINDPGDVVGYYCEAGGVDVCHGFLFDKQGTYTPIDVNNIAPPNAGVSAVSTYAIGINNPGDIVGYYKDKNLQTHGFLYDKKGNFSTIDVPNAAHTFLSGINSNGVMVGSFIDGSGLATHGFVNTSGTFVQLDLPDVPGVTFGAAINDNGQVLASGATSALLTVNQ